MLRGVAILSEEGVEDRGSSGDLLALLLLTEDVSTSWNGFAARWLSYRGCERAVAWRDSDSRRFCRSCARSEQRAIAALGLKRQPTAAGSRPHGRRCTATGRPWSTPEDRPSRSLQLEKTVLVGGAGPRREECARKDPVEVAVGWTGGRSSGRRRLQVIEDASTLVSTRCPRSPQARLDDRQ